MLIVLAPDSFKDCLPAEEVARALAEGFRQGWPEATIVRKPMADGGEGTTRTVVDATGGKLVPVHVTGPLGEPHTCAYGLTADCETAIVEIAAASGLESVPPHLRNPMRTTTYGTGQLIRAALAARPRRLLIGLGGSATVDGGAGLLQALGVRLLDSAGNELPACGEALQHLHSLDSSQLDPRLQDTEILVACDVDTPLTGAAATFGPQKGATPAMVEQLDHNLALWGRLLRERSGLDVASLPGAGAAGGAAAALVAVLGGRLTPGAELVASLIGLEPAIAAADLVVTGEGRMDAQTSRGKVPAGVAQLARRYGKPVIAFTGALAEGPAQTLPGIDAVFSISPRPQLLVAALSEAAANLRSTGAAVAAVLRMRLAV